MKLSVKKGFIVVALAAFLACLTNLSAFAAGDVTLSAVKIEGKNNSFQITLKTSSDTNVISRVQSADKLVLELENTKASDMIQTSFSNAGAIKDVIVQPLRNNTTRLLLSGINVAKSKVIIDSTAAPAVSQETPVDENVAVIDNSTQPQSNTISSQEFIEQNNPQNVQDQSISTDQATMEEPAPAETTGTDDSILSVESNTDPQATSPDMAAESDLFKPSADLGIDATAIAPAATGLQESAAQQTAKSIASSQDSLLSNTWLLRFGIIFVFITVLVAYLRKEKLLSFRPKTKKPASASEHLDIYRSLHAQTKPASYNKSANIRSSSAGLNSLASQKQLSRTAEIAKRMAPNNNLARHSALNSYKKTTSAKNVAQQPAANLKPQAKAPKATTRSAAAPTDNVAFLKNMADIYEKSGRHDLAANINNKIRKSLAKA